MVSETMQSSRQVCFFFFVGALAVSLCQNASAIGNAEPLTTPKLDGFKSEIAIEQGEVDGPNSRY